jgi:predicted ABC-type ATPase
VTSKLFMLMVAGPNGSGKTTLTRQLFDGGVKTGTYINPDDIADALSGSAEQRTSEAQKEAERLRQRCIRSRESFSFETVMSHPSKIDLLRQAKAAGFRVGLFFVATEAADLNVARVRQRVALGGHPVPETRIRGRYDRSLGLLLEAVLIADQVVLFDNSTRAAPGEPVIMRPVIRFDAGPPATVKISDPIPAWSSKAVWSLVHRCDLEVIGKTEGGKSDV